MSQLLPPDRIAARVRWEYGRDLHELGATLQMAWNRVRHDLATTGLPNEDALGDMIATATAMLARTTAVRALARVERALEQVAEPMTTTTHRTGDPDRPTLVVVR